MLAIGAGALWLIPARAPEVRLATVREIAGGNSVSIVLNASGYVTARRRATVSSKITGKLVDVRVEVAESSGEVITDWAPGQGVERFVASAAIEARKPADGQAACCGR